VKVTLAKVFASLLLAAGISALVYGGFGHTEAHDADVGPLEITVALGFLGGNHLLRRRA
jgi:hypothetical protein